MKNLHFLFLIITINTQLKAQDYIPMAVEQAQWTIFVSDDDGFPPFDEFYYGYRIEGDTIINSLLYKKVYRRDFLPVNPDIGNPLVGPFVAGNETLFGTIRDDVPNKRVYGIQFLPVGGFVTLCSFGEDEEFLMYDFNKSVGDNYDDFCIVEGQANITLAEINIQNLFNQNRIVHTLNDSGNGFWGEIYEAVGGNSGLFEAILFPLGCPCGGLSNYCIGSDEECLEGFILATNEEILNNVIKIYPNPTQSKFTIEISDAFSNIIKLEIRNLIGEKIKALNIKNTKTIDISYLGKGVYFITIYNNNKLISVKKIVKL